MNRRTALQMIGGGLAALSFRRSLRAAATERPAEYFIVIHAAGGWDVTLWSDPRNEQRGLIDPATNANTTTGALKHWKPVKLSGSAYTFEVVTPRGSPRRFGPAIGDLLDLHDRITVVNGIAMNTVSHDDGTVFSITGRHRAGSIIPASSIDVMLTNELGTGQLMPDVSIMFPSSFVGDQLDRRAIPLRVTNVEAITKLLWRSDAYLDHDDRDAIGSVLVEEARELALDPSQHQALPKLLDPEFTQAFSPKQLTATYPQFHGVNALHAGFAMEAIKRNLVRCIAFGAPGFDTHAANYQLHAGRLQDVFDLIASLLKLADATPHPTRAAAKLSDHLHILVLSEFCRTPAINMNGGRDHYPNNSALIVSPKFKAGTFGETDVEQLLPREFGAFSDGRRAITPPDVLATFLGAFGLEPRRYLRDGEVARGLLATA